MMGKIDLDAPATIEQIKTELRACIGHGDMDDYKAPVDYEYAVAQSEAYKDCLDMLEGKPAYFITLKAWLPLSSMTEEARNEYLERVKGE